MVTLARGPDVPFGPTLTISYEPLRREAWSTGSLRDVFGLTARESDIVLMLLGGTESGDLTEALEIGPETIKTHMSQSFRKTATRSRLHLIAKLLGGAASSS